MMALTNAQVQRILGQALALVVEEELSFPKRDALLKARLSLVKTMLTTTMLYSASGNDIPGLGGRGLKEAITLATAINDGAFDFTRRDTNLAPLGKYLLGDV